MPRITRYKPAGSPLERKRREGYAPQSNSEDDIIQWRLDRAERARTGKPVRQIRQSRLLDNSATNPRVLRGVNVDDPTRLAKAEALRKIEREKSLIAEGVPLSVKEATKNENKGGSKDYSQLTPTAAAIAPKRSGGRGRKRGDAGMRSRGSATPSVTIRKR